MPSSKCLLWAAAIVGIVAVTTIIIAIAVPAWHNVDVDATLSRTITTQTYTGLWSTCTKEVVKEYSSFSCSDVTSDDALRAVQAMTMMGAIAAAGAVVCIFLKCCIMKDNWLIAVIIIVLSVSAGVFMIIGAAVFAGEVNSTEAKDLHAGFALTVLASGMTFAVAILMLCVVLCSKDKVRAASRRGSKDSH